MNWNDIMKINEENMNTTINQKQEKNMQEIKKETNN